MKKYYISKLYNISYVFLFLFGILFNPVYSQQTYTFTNAGATGSLGPTQTQVTNAYQLTNLNGNVTVSGSGIQVWAVPVSGMYRIEAYGAQGGTSGGVNPGANGGLGAIMKGDFNLTAGQTLSIVVGQEGSGSNYGGSGGGGSYVVASGNMPLCVAGGGGGAIGYPGYPNGYYNGEPGLTTTTGGNANVMGGPTYGVQATGTGGGAPGFGGTNGYGGGSGVASGGGGFYDDGANGGTPTDPTYSGGGKCFMNGSAGGIGAQYSVNSGGFGGGGGTQAASGYGAGGGGYSGGGGGSLLFSPTTVSGNGGGGGSFNSGTNQTNTSGVNAGHGKVIIVELCNISLVANGTNANGAICVPNSATLTTNAVSNYSWNTGATSSSLVITPTITTSYTLTAMSVSNCVTSAVITITVDNAAPTLTVSNTANAGGICPTKTVVLNAIGATTYTWAGGSVPVTNGVAFAPPTASDYTVTGENACGTGSAVTSISVHPLPNLTAVASTPSLCSGLSLTLTSVGNSTGTAWSGGPIPITEGVGFSPTSTITYSVIGTSALSCTAMASVPVTVVTTPILAPTKTPSIVCIGGSSTLTASGATNYTWTSATQTLFTNPLIVTPTAPGVETFTVTKGNSNCFDTKTISVITNSLPGVFALATPTLICSLSQSTLAAAGGQTYTWTAPGFGPVIGPSPIVSPSVTTMYTVAAHDGTCVNTTTVLVTTNPIPTISISGSTNTICKGASVTMTATGGLTYTWTNTVNTNTVFTTNISESPTITAAFTAVGNNAVGCTASSQFFVQVNGLPTVGGTVIKPLVCSGGLSTLTATGANSYTWDPISIYTPSTVVSTTAVASGPVIYTVTGMNATTGCQNTKTLQVTVFVPVLTISGNTNTCMGGNVTLQGSGGNQNTYSWNTGSGTPVNFQTITASLTAASVFTLSAMSTSGSINCPGTKTVQLGIYFNPTITAVAQRTTICKYETFELYGDGGVTYDWSNGMQGSTVTVGPINNVQTLNYTVTGTDANGCANTATVQVKVSGCTGIDELSTANNSVLIYPNPNNGVFTIQADKDLVLTLSNELGQVIRTIGLSGINSRKVSVSDLAKGIYFISGQGVNQKIVVAK